jgi:hypothetical protein
VTDVKKGDRVRVVVEGVATYCSSGGNLTIGVDSTHTLHTIVTNHPSVVSVEVLAKQFKVGDTVSGDDFAKLPVGTIVKLAALSGAGIRRIKRDDRGWVNILDSLDIDDPRGPRTIEYLP